MKKWATKEVKTLKDNYRTKSREDLMILLSDRTWKAIQLKAFRLKLCYRIGTPEERFWRQVNKKQNDLCWNWTGCCDSRGYGVITINKKMIKAHRFSYVLNKSKIPEDKPCVCHMCNNPLCVNPSHLCADTHENNMKHRDKCDRQARGENNGMAKLTKAQVKKIRRVYSQGHITQKELAQENNVHISTISRVILNEIWKHII